MTLLTLSFAKYFQNSILIVDDVGMFLIERCGGIEWLLSDEIGVRALLRIDDAELLIDRVKSVSNALQLTFFLFAGGVDTSSTLIDSRLLKSLKDASRLSICNVVVQNSFAFDAEKRVAEFASIRRVPIGLVPLFKDEDSLLVPCGCRSKATKIDRETLVQLTTALNDHLDLRELNAVCFAVGSQVIFICCFLFFRFNLFVFFFQKNH